MSRRSPAVIVRRVTQSRLAFLFLLFATLISFTGCSYWERTPSRRYYNVRVTNPRGEMIAEYVAENFVVRTERGYRFRAVERTSRPPYELTMRYPRGRVIEVGGPNIIVTPSGKPIWLCEMDGY